MIISKYIDHLLDLLHFIFIILIQKKNEQELSKKNLLFLYLFLSQILILPLYQQKGLDRRLLTAIYNDLGEDSCVQDITGILSCF
jgi:hypothetical protein